MTYPKNLKYPESEYNKLVKILEQISECLNISEYQPMQLHYMAYQQVNKYQPHNKIYRTSEGLKRGHSMNEDEIKKSIIMVNLDLDLELYPNDCNDKHIETATKKAIKQVLTDSTIKHF
mgnify:CR=1 FL=1